MNNNIITATPSSGTAILPTTFGTNIIQTQQSPHATHQFNGNSFIQLLPSQINGPIIAAGNMNMGGISGDGSTKLGTTNSPINASNCDNHNSTFTFMPQMAFITSGVGTTTLPAGIGDLSTLQQTASTASAPMISVITSTNNTTTANNQHNTSFLIPSGVGNNSTILSTPVGVTPFNVILTTSNSSVDTVTTNNVGVGGTSINNMGIDSNNMGNMQTAGGKHNVSPTVLDIKSNSVIPASVLICNRQQYQLHGSNNKTTTNTPPTPRNSAYPQTMPLTVFNPELVKQIVVGNAPKNSVITHASTKNTTHVPTQTLLKPSSVMTSSNVAGMKQPQPNTSSKSATLVTHQAPVVSAIAAITTGSTAGTITQTMKKQQSTYSNTLQQSTTSVSKAKSVLQTPINTKIPLSEAARAVVSASSSTIENSPKNSDPNDQKNSGRNESHIGELKVNLDMPTERSGEYVTQSTSPPSPPPPVATSSTEPPIQANVSVIKTTSVSNQSNDASKIKTDNANLEQNKSPMTIGECSSESFKVDKDLIKPNILVQAKLIEKQESLLKARPIQNVIECNTSPRSKRSKSLNCTLKDAPQMIAPSLTKTKPTSLIKSSEQQQTLSERRHSTASDGGKILKQQKNSPPRRKQSLTSKANEMLKYEIIDLIDYNEEGQADDITGNKTINTADNKKGIGIPKGENKLEIEENIDEDVKLSQTQNPSSSENIEEESELVEGSTLKIEIIMEEEEEQQHQSKQQSLSSSLSAHTAEDIILQNTKVEETQTSVVEHTQDSLEKSLYCDEKISISSTSTSSSRQSLHDDILLAPSHPSTLMLSQNSISFAKSSNQPSTSLAAAAGIMVKTPNSINSTTEGSLSCALKMLANFNMLTWNQRIGSARGTNMRFQLNEFNLIEINERCSPRTRIHTAYEKPIYERESVPNVNEKHNSSLLYLCRRCNCHGPALDFLAPEFCSLDCLKRDSRKRRHEEYLTVARKRKTQEQPLQQQQQLPSTAHLACKKSFRWSTYLPEKFNAIAAPVNLFINPFPTGPNRFQIGMKLEAIDPENCSLFCVCTIVDIQGYRLKLTFDGYEYMYDFWVNADSMDIFPPGWCAKTKRILQPPKGTCAEDFSWSTYLHECRAIAAHRVLFTHLNVSLGTHNPFKIGMHLEAEDLNDTGKLCVASVADVLDNRIRVHFDGWDDCYDYWVDISSPYIHSCGWHVGRHQLIVPPEFENTTFIWNDYIKNHGSGMAATEEMFSTRDPIDFKPNMKLEVVDPRNPSLIRPATVVGRKGHRVKLHLDCWASNYCFWLEDDSADLHPIGWCEATGHDLEPPPGYKMRTTTKTVCATFGCRGIGNAKRLYLNTHTTRDCCPYSAENWRQKSEKPPRLEHDEIARIFVGAGGVKREEEPNRKASLQWRQTQPQQQQKQQNRNQNQQLNEAQILQQIQLLDNIKTRHVIQQEQQQKQNQTAVNQRARLSNDNTNNITSQQQQGQQKKLIKIEQAADKTMIKNTRKPYQPNVDKVNAAAAATSEESTSLLLPQIKIAKEFLYDYGPRLQQNYNIWQRNVAFDMQRIKRNPLLWSTKDTCAFVQCVLRNSDITETFLREDIDGNALMLLQQADLTEMLKLKLGPAVKLYSCILQLRTLTAVKFDAKLKN